MPSVTPAPSPAAPTAVRRDIVMLAGENVTSWIVYNRLVQEFGPFPVLVEPPVGRRSLIANRVRKLGLFRTLSQVAFVFLARPFIARAGQARIAEICQRQGLETAAPEARHMLAIPSVNSEACWAALAAIAPRVVVVNGTRIIKAAVLAATPATFLNIHQGITPQYRGAHGAYWALYRNDRQNCGVTIHVVDEGIDTGAIVAQAAVTPQSTDNFVTYPYLQTAAALPGLIAAVKAALGGTLATRPLAGPSGVWYHPGIFEYLAGRLRGVR